MRFLLVLGAVALVALVGLGLFVVTSGGTRDAAFGELDTTRALPQGDVYRSAMTDIPSINPFTTVDAGALRYVLTFTHGSLLDQDPRTGAIRPADAEAWERDGKDGRWRFRLRSDLCFADGEPVRNEDLEFTIAMARHEELQPKSDMAVAIESVRQVVAIGVREIVLEDPSLDERSVIEFGGRFRIAQRAWFLRETKLDGTDIGALARAVANVIGCGPGTGPYRLATRADGTADWVPGSHLNLEQSPRAWQRAAMPRAWNLAGFQHRFIPEESTRLLLLIDESIDWFTSAAGTDLAKLARENERIAANYRRLTYAHPQIRVADIIWNCTDEELSNPAIRVAIGHIFDRQRIIEDLYRSLATLPPDCESTNPEVATACREAARFDLDLAAKLLAGVGCGPTGRRLRVEVLCAKESPALRRILDLAVPDAERCNVELVPTLLDYASLYSRLDEGDFQGAIRLDYVAGIASESDSEDHSSGLARWNDAHAKQLFETAKSSTSAGDRDEARSRLRIHEIESQPTTEIVRPLVEVLLHRRFRDAEPGARGLFPEAWWVEPSERIVGGVK